MSRRKPEPAEDPTAALAELLGEWCRDIVTTPAPEIPTPDIADLRRSWAV